MEYIKKLTPSDFREIAQQLGIEPETLQAVQKVETGGRGGFLADGKPVILFEGHIFWRELRKRGIDPQKHVKGNEDILYPKWERGHYKSGLAEYSRLEKARAIHREAADASASWGMFQVMGFNYASCGCKSVTEFVAKMCESERAHLELAVEFMRKNGMIPFLKSKKWAQFARCYNGPGYAQNNYDKKLQSAYLKLKVES